jgi:hypothetical protein
LPRDGTRVQAAGQFLYKIENSEVTFRNYNYPHDIQKRTEYEEKILAWRAGKYDELVRENGWLALAGLFWLKEGRNLVGSNPMCEVVLPERAPTFIGVAELKGKPSALRRRKGCG